MRRNTRCRAQNLHALGIWAVVDILVLIMALLRLETLGEGYVFDDPSMVDMSARQCRYDNVMRIIFSKG